MPNQQGHAAEPLIEAYRKHYAATFARYDATSRSADWGEWPDVHIRYGKMLEVIEPARAAQTTVSLLDVVKWETPIGRPKSSLTNFPRANPRLFNMGSPPIPKYAFSICHMWTAPIGKCFF
jgi:hypothetical protein